MSSGDVLNRAVPLPDEPLAETGPASTARGRPGGTVLALLAVILLVGAALRFYGLGIQSLWIDEMWTWHTASRADTLRGLLTTGTLPRDVHPPLYFVMHYFLQKHVGDTEAILRLPSAVAGVASILVIYLLGRRLYSDREGLIAAALMAVLQHPIRYSQEARAYSMLLLFSMLSVYFLIDVVRCLCRGEPLRPGSVVGYMISVVVLSYLHYYGLYLAGFQALAASVVLLLRRRRMLPLLWLLLVPVVLVYIPWLGNMLRSLGATHVHPDPPEPLAFVRWLGFQFSPPWHAKWVAFAVYAWLLGITLYNALRKKTPAAARPAVPCAGVMLLLWLVVPFVLVHVQAAFWRSTYSHRNMIICTAAAYLLVARGIARIPVRPVLHAVITVLIAAALVGQLVFVVRYYSRPLKDQYREAVAYVVENEAKYPNSMIVGWRCPPGYYDYYFEKLGSSRRVEMWSGPSDRGFRVLAGAQVRRPEYIWIITGHWEFPAPFEALMRDRFSVIAHKRFWGAEVLFMKNDRR